MSHARMIRAIHSSCRAQGIDTETRRAMQMHVTGVNSLSVMSTKQLSMVLDRLNHGRPKTNFGEWSFVFRMPVDRQVVAKKIYRLAQTLGARQVPPMPVMPKAYIEGITRQMRGSTQPLEFCDAPQLLRVVAALKIHLDRHPS